MKKLILITGLVAALAGNAVYAQSPSKDLPDGISVIPYNLQVGYNTTTLIVFPASIIDGDRGFNDIIVQKQKDVQNMLKVKAAVKGFQPTNLHVYTTDGKLYAFNVSYIEYPQRTTFDLNNLELQSASEGPLTLSSAVLSNAELKQMADKAKQAGAFFSKKAIHYGMKFELKTIHTVKDVLLFGFVVANDSNLDFDIDFTKLYIKDKKKAKRSSVQEQEINTLYSDPLSKIQGEKEVQFVVAVPKFTIPDKKNFFIQMSEKNGGRHISLKIKNKHLLKARQF